MQLRPVVLSLCTLLLWACALPAQPYVPGPQVLTFFSEVDDSDQPYAIYLPKAFDAGKKYPLVVSLHGAWSNHRLNLKRVFGMGNRPGETDAEATRYFPPFRDVDYIVASPLARGTMGYQGIPEKDVYDVLEDVKKRFPIDEDRVYLTGLSMGGGGTLWLGLTRPDVWAALAPVCPAPPEGAEELAPNALNIPMHFFHGDQDTAVPVDVSRRWHKLITTLGGSVDYLEYPGVKHNSWDLAYKDAAIFDWFSKFRRNRFPERVRFATRAYKYNSAYWVRIDGLTPGTLASIDARFTGDNRMEIETSALDGFTLNLEGHPKLSAGRPLRITIDGAAASVPAKARMASFTRSGSGWKAGRYEPPKGAKRPGEEGPVGEAIASGHIYVYGTADSPGAEALNRRREQAVQASEWSSPRLRLLLSFRVAADKEVTEADIRSANLVLLGTKETNSLIARFADRFPLELKAGAADYGLIFVAPVDGRYLVVNSGLPWWTGAERAKRPGLRFLRAPYALMQSFGDYIVFRGSLDDVVAEGRFDPAWKLRSEHATKLQETGAVLVR